MKEQTPIKPMLMQYAELEYMCCCGYKFYPEHNKEPDYCPWCGRKFHWE